MEGTTDVESAPPVSQESGPGRDCAPPKQGGAKPPNGGTNLDGRVPNPTLGHPEERSDVGLDSLEGWWTYIFMF